MGNIKLAIFDFDGTLADSFPFFTSVFNQLAKEHRFEEIDFSNACAFRGYTARQMMRHVGMPQWKLPMVARSFMSLMKANCHDVPLFDGIGAMLRELDRDGVRLAIVTSNSCENVSAVLGKENLALIRHMESGVSIFGKASRIARVLSKSGIAGRDALYIGDQVSDLEAARKAGVPFGAVAWGYASIESLLEHRPEHVFRSIDDLRRITASCGGERPGILPVAGSGKAPAEP